MFLEITLLPLWAQSVCRYVRYYIAQADVETMVIDLVLVCSQLSSVLVPVYFFYLML